MAKFELSPEWLEAYRTLAYQPDARCQASLIPFATLVWDDEHPKEFRSSRVDEKSRDSVLSLVEARTQLWFDGRVHDELQQLWTEAKATLPNWPGFQRVLISDELKEGARRVRAEIEAMEEELCEAGEGTRTLDPNGIVHFKMHLRPAGEECLVLQPYRSGNLWVFDDDRIDLVEEPFVDSATRIIDAILARLQPPLHDADNGFRLVFSARPFRGEQAELELVRSEAEGNWYRFSLETLQRLNLPQQMEGWLGPALFHYFHTSPERIHVRAESRE
jgi:hypothetical protein